jgi:hypothetical protein
MEPDHLHFSHELDIEGGTACVTAVVAVALGGGRLPTAGGAAGQVNVTPRTGFFLAGPWRISRDLENNHFCLVNRFSRKHLGVARAYNILSKHCSGQSRSVPFGRFISAMLC